ncbi:MAG: MbcA/ParS/Xre antitoxin family protein [Acidiferrobacterales bacterium]|nr:MbcA/ParS/Xre antitoxin family protein [Acidiferrobacterales bacterium]
MLNNAETNRPDARLVVLKAFDNACKELGISRDQASLIVGVDKATLNRNRTKGFDPNSKTGELCLQFVRAYRSLFAIAGGDRGFMRHWLNTYNSALAGEPLKLMFSIVGLVHVNEYLDALRGKV